MIVLDDMALRERLRPLVDDARLRQAIANVSADRLFLSSTETHVAVIARHNALLAADRGALSPTAVAALELLDRLAAADYEAAAELAAGEIVASWLPYADAAAVRARIGGATSRPN